MCIRDRSTRQCVVFRAKPPPWNIALWKCSDLNLKTKTLITSRKGIQQICVKAQISPETLTPTLVGSTAYQLGQYNKTTKNSVYSQQQYLFGSTWNVQNIQESSTLSLRTSLQDKDSGTHRLPVSCPSYQSMLPTRQHHLLTHSPTGWVVQKVSPGQSPYTQADGCDGSSNPHLPNFVVCGITTMIYTDNAHLLLTNSSPLTTAYRDNAYFIRLVHTYQHSPLNNCLQRQCIFHAYQHSPLYNCLQRQCILLLVAVYFC